MEIKQEDLYDAHGNKYETSEYIFTFKGKHWFIKVKNEDEKKRDYLGYLLGKGWCNIAEVKIPDKELLKIIEKDKNREFNLKNTWLVRLGQDYEKEELATKNLNKAVATELIFSLWIRRRDTHAHNRIYNNGIPIFFDHQTGFLGEESLSDINYFFTKNKNKPGRAGTWRIKEISNHSELKNKVINKRIRKKEKDKTLTFHYITDIKDFEKQLNNTINYIQNIDWNLRTKIKKAGFSNSEQKEIYKFLKNNMRSLKKDTQRMKKVLYQQCYYR